ncbi:MAG: hypothetical protein AB7Q00_14680 [Phycisphaerales bacterium]
MKTFALEVTIRVRADELIPLHAVRAAVMNQIEQHFEHTNNDAGQVNPDYSTDNKLTFVSIS